MRRRARRVHDDGHRTKEGSVDDGNLSRSLPGICKKTSLGGIGRIVQGVGGTKELVRATINQRVDAGGSREVAEGVFIRDGGALVVE